MVCERWCGWDMSTLDIDGHEGYCICDQEPRPTTLTDDIRFIEAFY
jgi:hypothetical protein